MTSATIYLTNECNLRCRHCAVGHDQTSKRRSLETADVLSVIRNLAEHGTRAITLLGGEVTTERSDLKPILEYCDAIGVRVSINTNLTDYERISPLLSIDALISVVVSLDGLTAATHNRMRGKGSFEKTIANLRLLCDHPRARSGNLLVDATFVLSAVNKGDVMKLPAFYKEFGLNLINFKTLQLHDRALTNKTRLSMSERELLDICTSFYALCMLEGGIKVDMHIPPAFGHYLNRLMPVPQKLWNFAGCGGTGVYTYVDLYGNNLPCPAMSFEENTASTLTAASPALSAVTNSIDSIQSRSLFRGFDRSREKLHRNRKMHPCNQCVFSDRCSPCTSEVIRGQDRGVVDICAAVLAHGDERIAGITQEIFAA